MLDPKIVSLYGQIGISIITQLIFAGTVLVSFYLKDTSIMLLVVGAAIANATCRRRRGAIIAITAYRLPQ